METEKEIDVSSLYSDPYCVTDNCLHRKIYTKKVPEERLLCNFVPYIEKKIICDDGEKAEVRFRIAAVMSDGRKLPGVELSIDELGNPNWAAKHLDPDCCIEVGTSVKEYIRHAVQSTSIHADRLVLYSVTGWKVIDGKY